MCVYIYMHMLNNTITIAPTFERWCLVPSGCIVTPEDTHSHTSAHLLTSQGLRQTLTNKNRKLL